MPKKPDRRPAAAKTKKVTSRRPGPRSRKKTSRPTRPATKRGTASPAPGPDKARDELEKRVAQRTAELEKANDALREEITERKQAEEALRESEERLGRFLESATDACSLFDSRLNYLTINEAGLRLFPPGTKREHVVGRNILDLIPTLRQTGRYDKYLEVMQTGEPFSAEDAVPDHKLLGGVYLNIRAFPVGDGLGMIVENVTDRKRAEEALRESRERLQFHVDRTPLAHMVFDLSFRVTEWNLAAERIFGYRCEEAVGQLALELIVPREAHPAVQEALEDLRRGEIASYSQDGNNLTKDGRVITCQWFNTPLRDSDGRVVALACMAQDITERKKAEEAVRESEEKYRNLVERNNDGVIIAQDRVLKFCNNRMGELFGYTVHEMLEIPFLDHFSPDERPRIRDIYQRRLRGESVPSTHEMAALHRDGTRIEIETNSGIITHQGRPATFSFLRDITERKQAAARERRLEKQLQQAQKLESLGVLAGGVAHDFNNLLAGMLGHSELALSKLPPENPACANIERVVQAAERASHLSRQMLAYAGRGQLEFRPTDLNDLAREILHLLEAAVPKRVRLSAQPTETPAVIEADLGQMQQVIMNLVINGAEAIGERPGNVMISTGSETLSDDERRYSRFTATNLASGRYVFLEVRDDGPGMDEETLSKVFDPFFTTKFVGRGLGLSALLGIVRGHKGGIDVQSEPGKGTTFRLVFPVTGQAPEDTKVVAAEGSLAGTILVIDDEEVVRTMTSEMLTPHGMKVLTAESGTAGVALYKERYAEIGLVLLDYSMPEMGGEETFKELRKINPDVPVILTSGFGQEEATRRFAGQGLTGFMQKPYRLAALLAEVRRCLGKA